MAQIPNPGGKPTQPTKPTQPASITSNLKTFIAWGIAAISLIALADYVPRAAIMFTIILIAGVLLTHWKDYVSIFNASALTKKK